MLLLCQFVTLIHSKKMEMQIDRENGKTYETFQLFDKDKKVFFSIRFFRNQFGHFNEKMGEVILYLYLFENDLYFCSEEKDGWSSKTMLSGRLDLQTIKLVTVKLFIFQQNNRNPIQQNMTRLFQKSPIDNNKKIRQMNDLLQQWFSSQGIRYSNIRFSM